ncbi:hypothetical protein [Pectinatus frisingensis]|uniref:hypothetical protein n=1 Tax=Pectinatus frisingensis TaxID=865 RepID=UPI0018C47063|nr:hypothetical protein [Pectinatus frisingensis]
MNISEETIQQMIAQHIGFQNICIPNVFLTGKRNENSNDWRAAFQDYCIQYEADLIYISKARYLTEVEIKISMPDFMDDFNKKVYHSSPLVRNLYYAFHQDFYEKNEEKIFNALKDNDAGIIAVGKKYPFVDYKKRAKVRKDVKPLDDKELQNLMRIGCMKWFTNDKRRREKQLCG